MASQRSTNSMEELLYKMLKDISLGKAAPDADLEFLVGLETAILQKLREPDDAQKAQSQAPPEGMGMGMDPGTMPPPEMPPGGMSAPGGGMGMGGMSGPGVPGVMSQPQTIPPDELRRMLG